MHFEVTHSKMNEGKGYMGETRARVERSYKMLNEVYNSGMFNGGSFGGVGNSMGVLLQRLAVERNECAMLENGLASISNIYLNLDSTLTGNSLMDNVTPDTQLDPDMVESITSVYSGSGDVPGKNGGRSAGKNINRKRNVSRSGGDNQVNVSNDPNRPFGIGVAQLNFKGGNPNPLTYGEDIIVVDSMDYLPLSNSLYNKIYVGYEEDGVWHEPWNSVHDSAIAPEDFPYIKTWLNYMPIANIADLMGLTCGDLLVNYFDGNGETYVYDASSLLINENVRENYENNISSVIASCEGNIPDGETVIVATSPSVNMTGCDGFNGFFDMAIHANACASINIAEAGVVCEITREGDHYTMNYNYYIIDYYDFDDNPEDLYDLNSYGIAQSFLGYGKISGTIEWDAGDY